MADNYETFEDGYHAGRGPRITKSDPTPESVLSEAAHLCSPCPDPNFCGALDSCPQNLPPESVLSEAARLVDGDRQTAYGHPKDNHACTAALWNAYIERRAQAEASVPGGGVLELDAFDVAMLNILQKCSRLAHTRHRDGLVDIAGFARNAEMVDE